MSKLIRLMMLGVLVVSSNLLSAQRLHKHDDDRGHRHYERDDRHYKKDRHHHKPQKHYARQHHKWAKPHRYAYKNHVYFPDYSMFYDPYRNGYVCHASGRWVFSRTIPRSYVNIDFGRARMVLVDNVPLERHPEEHYHVYEKRYPRNPSINVNISL